MLEWAWVGSLRALRFLRLLLGYHHCTVLPMGGSGQNRLRGGGLWAGGKSDPQSDLVAEYLLG